LKSQGENSLNNFPLDEAAAKQLKVAIEQVDQQEFTSEAKALELSNVYAQYRQIDTAIEELEKARNAGSKNPEVFLFLGDLLTRKSAVEPAREQYQKALELASNSNHPQASEISIIARTELASFLIQEAKAKFKQLQPQQINHVLSQTYDNLFSEDLEAFLHNSNLVAAMNNLGSLTARFHCPDTCGPGKWRTSLHCSFCQRP
jgi:tetratricopeptide (TPR) repeat protein